MKNAHFGRSWVDVGFAVSGREPWVRLALMAACTFAAVGVGSAARGQTTRAGGGGLDGLSDDALYVELSRRGLDGLLERALEANHVPAERRKAIRAMAAAGGSGLSGAEREVMFAQATKSTDSLLATEKDPKVLFDQGAAMISSAVAPALQTVEYWGDSTAAMARLRPVAESAAKLLARSADIGRKDADALAEHLDVNSAAAMAKYKKADDLATEAEFTRRMNDYAVVASLDPADPNRARLADETIDYLKQFDVPESTVQGNVRLQIGKLQLAKGLPDDAIGTLDSIWAEDTKVVPAPAAAQRFEARYFAALAAMKAGRTDDADRRLDGLIEWSKTSLEKESQRGAEAAEMLLRYRIDAAAKRTEKARADLLALVGSHPEVEEKVLDQLAASAPEAADVHTLDVLDLKAILRRGQLERQKPESEVADAKALERAVAAAREIVVRKGSAGLTSEMVENAAFNVPLLYQREGKNLDAANAALDYLDVFALSGKNATAAFEGAGYLISKLRSENPEDVAVGRAYDRWLKAGVSAPFNKKELVYPYARRLQLTGQYAEAARWYGEVPETDPQASLARFYRLVALKQVMDEQSAAQPGGAAQPEAARLAAADEILALAAKVSAEARAGLAKGGGAADAQRYALILSRTAMVSADVALRQKKDPKAAVAALEGFEAGAAPLANAKALDEQAVNLRVLALMGAGQTQEATRQLVALLQATDGGEGADIVLSLLTKLTDEFDAAKKAGDQGQMLSLARSRAELSGFLVKWAEGNSDPKIHESAYRYRIFDADTKRQAAGLETDAAARTKGLEEALSLYKGLQDPNRPDGIVDLGIGLIEYDLGKYEEAQQAFAGLLSARRLGRPTLEEERNGEIVTVPNDRYWEAFLKNLRANLKLVEAGKAGAEVKQKMVDALEEQYARWGAGLGGAKWGPEFEKLRQEIAPDYHVPDVSGK